MPIIGFFNKCGEQLSPPLSLIKYRNGNVEI